MNVDVTCNRCGNCFTVYINQDEDWYAFILPQYICPNDGSIMRVEDINRGNTIIEGTQP